MATPRKQSQLKPRRAPSQQRARERIENILDVTARLLEDIGFDGLTTILIAAELKISVGSLYHYFPNKHAILRALGQRWLDAFAEEMRALEQLDFSGDDLPRFAEEAVSRIVAVYRRQKGVLPLVQAMFAVPELRDLDTRHDNLVIGSMQKVLAGLGYDAAKAERERLARAFLEITHALALVIVNQRGERAARTQSDLVGQIQFLLQQRIQAG